MLLSSYGDIANFFWLDTPKHFANAHVLEFIFMPNHFHGIIRLENDIAEIDARFVDIRGIPQHFSMPIEAVDEGTFEDGFGFDGSAIATLLLSAGVVMSSGLLLMRLKIDARVA